MVKIEIMQLEELSPICPQNNIEANSCVGKLTEDTGV
jgi:hypothetical protein